MASKSSNQPGDKSRFRVLLIEGDVLPGELQVFAQTLASAIRPTTPLPPRTTPAIPAPKPPTEEPNLFNGVVPEDVPDAHSDTAPEQPTVKPQNGAARKKLRTPQLISNLEFTSGEKSLTDYVKEIDPKQHSKRYLAATYWLRKYRNIAEVDTDHIYSCYRALGLNVPKDVGAALRALKKQGWLESGSKDGFYKITHIGENQLIKTSE